MGGERGEGSGEFLWRLGLLEVHIWAREVGWGWGRGLSNGVGSCGFFFLLPFAIRLGIRVGDILSRDNCLIQGREGLLMDTNDFI